MDSSIENGKTTLANKNMKNKEHKLKN